MMDDIGHGGGQERNERQIGGWRIVASAWVLVAVFVAVLFGATALACLRGGQHPDAHLAGAVIPRHDTSCGGPGIPSAPGADGCENLPIFEDRSAYW
jgi:hypothetical protein